MGDFPFLDPSDIDQLKHSHVFHNEISVGLKKISPHPQKVVTKLEIIIKKIQKQDNKIHPP